MSGTKEGGAKAGLTNKRKYGPEYYKKIGQMGGKAGHGISYYGGFASRFVGPDGLTGKERAKVAGSKGGQISRRYRAIRIHNVQP